MKKTPVLLASIFLGVVGVQAVFIAHTHKMITGQPLLLGQDHRSLSHLPPFIFSKIGHFFRSRFQARTSPATSFGVSRDLRGGWESASIVPFVTLSEHGNQYVVIMEAPGLCASNIEISLTGRELHLAAQTVITAINGKNAVRERHFSTYRVRLPGPISETGPPPPEFSSDGRLRLILQKAPASDNADVTSLTIL